MSERILIVDDDRDLAETMGELIEIVSQDKLTATLAFNGEQALAAAMSDSSLCAIVMDIDMPVMNGFAAAQAIKAKLGRQAPRLIAMSGSQDHVRLANGGGAFDAAFHKPVEIDRLLRALELGPA